jgi:hypothetical protein
MTYTVTFEGVEAAGTGVWRAQLAPGAVRRLSDAKSGVGACSVVGVFAPRFDATARTLSVQADKVTVLNVGQTEQSVFVDLGNAVMPRSSEAASTVQMSRPPSSMQQGDVSFLRSCREHRLHQPLVDMADRLLAEVRRLFPGEMTEGLNRKWVNHPDNFMALTIQHQDQSFAVHVKGRPEDFPAPSLDLKPDRGSYLRFKLKSPGQFDDALRVVLQSAAANSGR